MMKERQTNGRNRGRDEQQDWIREAYGRAVGAHDHSPRSIEDYLGTKDFLPAIRAAVPDVTLEEVCAVRCDDEKLVHCRSEIELEHASCRLQVPTGYPTDPDLIGPFDTYEDAIAFTEAHPERSGRVPVRRQCRPSVVGSPRLSSATIARCCRLRVSPIAPSSTGPAVCEDAMTLAIAHKTTTPDKRVIVDTVREVRPPFSPSAVVDDFAALLKSYRVSKVVGDHYGGKFVKEPFRRHGIGCEVKQPKSDLFRDMLPLLNAGRISLRRHDRLIAQIVGLERRVSRAGRDSIDHAPGAHDDLANAAAGVAAVLTTAKSYDSSLDWVCGPDVDAGDAWQAARLSEHIRRYA